MRKTPALALVAALMTGCAGLHVEWVATATYNTPRPQPEPVGVVIEAAEPLRLTIAK